jgi:ribosomal protein S18 acetylase RimI-like enzyme
LLQNGRSFSTRIGAHFAPEWPLILSQKTHGYLLYHCGYDTDRAMRLLHIIDLYVQETKRRHGVGEALMRAAAKICQEAGGREMIWLVFVPNKLAFQFYEGLGAKRIQELAFMYWPIPTS